MDIYLLCPFWFSQSKFHAIFQLRANTYETSLRGPFAKTLRHLSGRLTQSGAPLGKARSSSAHTPPHSPSLLARLPQNHTRARGAQTVTSRASRGGTGAYDVTGPCPHPDITRAARHLVPVSLLPSAGVWDCLGP